MADAGPGGRWRVLVLGGTGVFGSRVCRLLANDPLIGLTVAARDRGKVDALAAELAVRALVMDWRRDLDRVLAEHRFDALVHVAGPFQGQDHRVAEACIRHRVHYLDLADDRAFVAGIERLDAAARAAEVLVCSGASTAPAITSAVLEAAITGGMSVERVAFGIVPGHDAPRGPALVEAILSGAGHAIPDQPGRRVWSDVRRMTVPGLGARWTAACDLPEPRLFARRFGVRDTYAAAGLELTILHLGLWLLTTPVRLGLVRSLAPLARPLAAIADRLKPFGTDRGGLRVDLDGGGRRRSWSLLADGGDGPFVPATPAVALVRKLAAGEVAARGAMACVGLLSLADIEAEWQRAHLRIGAGWLDGDAMPWPPLYRRVLGASYGQMPAAWQALHDSAPSVWRGQCVCDSAETSVGRLISWLFQLPKADGGAPIILELGRHGGGEVWTRRIAGRVMRSRQYIGVRKPRGSVVEQFGPLAFDLALAVGEGRMDLAIRGARAFGVPLPRWAWPRVTASESADGGLFRFDVEIGLPLVGRLVRYRGWLTDR